MGYDWSPHKPKVDENGNEESRFIKFTTPDQKAAGVIVDINETTFGGSRPDAVPNLVLEQPDRSVKEVGLSQVNLLRQVAEAGPEIGDHIEITFTGEGPKQPGKNPAKLFKVVVTPKAMQASNGAGSSPPVDANDSPF